MVPTEILAVVTGPGQDGVLGTGEVLASRCGGRATSCPAKNTTRRPRREDYSGSPKRLSA